MLPEYGILMCVKGPVHPPRPVPMKILERTRRQKWKISYTYTDAARVDKEHIMAYTWSCTFFAKYAPGVTIEVVFYMGSYQVYYRYGSCTTNVIFVPVEKMNETLMRSLIDQRVTI